MKFILVFFLFFGLRLVGQNKITVSVRGWLVYRYNDNLAFFPIKDQSKSPTYENFFTEDKGDGERMNNNYSAPPKLLIAKTYKLKLYEYYSTTKHDTLIGKYKFYIQPVTYVYEVADKLSDTTNHEYSAGCWKFMINGRLVLHSIYYFLNRSGQIQFLTTKDSVLATKGGRRKTISIYPPH